MNKFWKTAFEIDHRLINRAKKPYAIIKSYSGNLQYFDSNIDVIVDGSLYDLFREYFSDNWLVTKRDAMKNKLYERNKLMLSCRDAKWIKIHLHKNAGWHDFAFVEREDILEDIERVIIKDNYKVNLSSRRIEGIILVLHMIFEKFCKSEWDNTFLSSEDYIEAADYCGLKYNDINWIENRGVGNFPLEELQPIWIKYYQNWNIKPWSRVRLLHHLLSGLTRYRRWKK